VCLVEIPGPFEYQVVPYWIKSENRQPPVTGAQITPVAAQASSSHAEAGAMHLIDGSGLQDTDNDGLREHSTGLHDMWLSEKGQTTGWVQFDLGAIQKLGTICLWNCNERWHTNRGVKTADISIWTESAGWQKIRDDVELFVGEGTDDYDEPMVVQLDGIEAQKVRLDELTNLGDTEHIGLSEVQFFEPAGPKAVRPYPADAAQGVGTSGVALQWQPGVGAAAHNVYLGTDSANLELLGKVQDAGEVKLSPLARDTKYYWRIDEVQADGSIVESKVWSFTTGGLVAWWKLDEAEGTEAGDSSGNNLVGKLVGEPQWQPSGGKVDGALLFDGDGDYVDLGDKPAFDLTDDITVMAWVKVNSFDKGWQAIVTKGDGAWRLARESDEDSIQFATGRYMHHLQVVRGTVSVNDGDWHHIAGVRSGQKMWLYVDGRLDVAGYASGKIPTNDWAVFIGENSERRGREWNGLIDDVRIYNCTFSEADIAAFHSGEALPAVAEVTLRKPAAKEPGKLVAHWKLDEANGDNVADASANDIAGTLMGDPQWQPSGGKIDGALLCDGDGDYVEVRDEAAFDFTDEMTVSCWIKVDTFDKDWQAIITKGDSAWRLHRNSNNSYLDFACTGVSGDMVPVDGGPTNVTDNSWHHVVGVYDGAKLQLYVDGRLDVSGDVSGTLATNDYPVLIGENAEQRDREFNGLIDEVCIYSFALEDDDVAMLASGEEPTAVAGVLVQEQSEAGGNKNWIAVLVIAVIVAGAVGLATRKKATTS
jgi:hypothetical protein